MDYIINYQTGIADHAKTLDEAKMIADAAAAYTQQDIVILFIDEEITRRQWWGVAFDPDVDDSEDPICFGDFGYYSDWT